MRTYEEIERDARPGSPFSNSTDGGAWTENWCDRCLHDKEFRDTGNGSGCPLLLAALTGKTPIEWMLNDRLSLGDTYHCIEFRDEDEGPTEPRPPAPQIPGQGALFDAEPYEGVRMFSDVVAQIKPAEVSH